jgi:hypothetical protein
LAAILTSETSVNKIYNWRHIPEDGILHSHRRENLKSHNFLYAFHPSIALPPFLLGIFKPRLSLKFAINSLEDDSVSPVFYQNKRIMGYIASSCGRINLSYFHTKVTGR